MVGQQYITGNVNGPVVTQVTDAAVCDTRIELRRERKKQRSTLH